MAAETGGDAASIVESKGLKQVTDTGAIEAGGAIAKWVELAGKAPGANVSTLTTSTGDRRATPAIRKSAP